MSTQIVMPPDRLALTVPAETNALVANSDRFVQTAADLVVDSEASFQFADSLQADWKAEAKQINDKRMELTKPLDAIKKLWMDFFAPAIEGRTKGVRLLQDKMSAFRMAERNKALAAQREAERLLREERERQEAEARRLEVKAAKLKTVAAQERAAQQAAEIRQVAAMMPETVALSAPEPVTVASNVAQVWKGEVVNTAEFLQWLVSRPEWFSVIEFKQAELNRMAKQFSITLAVPGTRFFQEDSFRSKSRR